MVKSESDALSNEQERLTEDQFIRHRLYGESSSAWRRYAELVLARPTIPSLIRYELITTILGSIPGALGLALRKIFYPFLFSHIGKGVVFGARVTIRHPERIKLGDGVLLDDDSLVDGRGAGDEGIVIGDRVIINRFASIQAKVGAITIGSDTNIGTGAYVGSQGAIRIGKNVSIAGGCKIAGGRYVVDRKDETGTKERFSGGEIRIEDNARLGMNVIVQDGVTLGEGAIAAPASVIMTDVPANTVVSGHPARPWRERKIQGSKTKASPVPGADTPGTPADLMVVVDRLHKWLEETRFAEFGGTDGLSNDESLFDADILDSVGLVSLVAWLEETFDVDVADEDLIPENFESVARIAKFVGGRVQKVHS